MSEIRKKHELKLLIKYFKDVEQGRKTFELRKNDRDFKVGDTLILKEYHPGDTDYKDGIYTPAHYTNNETVKKIVYILQGGQCGLEEGYVILGIQ